MREEQELCYKKHESHGTSKYCERAQRGYRNSIEFCRKRYLTGTGPNKAKSAITQHLCNLTYVNLPPDMPFDPSRDAASPVPFKRVGVLMLQSTSGGKTPTD